MRLLQSSSSVANTSATNITEFAVTQRSLSPCASHITGEEENEAEEEESSEGAKCKGVMIEQISHLRYDTDPRWVLRVLRTDGRTLL